jgi:hypothetical protein
VCSSDLYFTSKYITEGESAESPNEVLKSWIYALNNGCEIGCHTHSHHDGANFTVDEWYFEMEKCVDILSTKMKIPKSEIKSFRTPFLSYNENTLKAVEKMGFLYDCSLEEGLQEDLDGKNFHFPYTLDSGLWELPAYVVTAPPNLRKKYAETQDYFNESDGKITGFDYNCFVEFQMTADELLATLKHTLDLRLEGNRAPFTFGGHTGIYVDGYQSEPRIKIPVKERRRAIEEFLDYALSKPEVRVVSPIKIIEWMRERK